MKKLVSMSVVAAFLAGAASAGTIVEVSPEPPVYTPAPAPMAVNWGGGYLGVQAGYGVMTYPAFPNDQSGFTGGIFGGYRHDAGSHVWGVEAEMSAATLFGTYITPTGDELKYGFGLYLTAGVPVSEDRRTLLSFSAGPSMVISEFGGNTDTSFGVMVGAGLEHMMTDSVILRGGVRYGYSPSLGNANITTHSYGFGAGVAFRF